MFSDSLYSVGGSVNAYLTYPSYLPSLYCIPDYSLVIHRHYVLRLVVLLFVWVWGGLRGIFMASNNIIIIEIIAKSNCTLGWSLIRNW